MVNRIDHIGIAVKNLEAALEFFEKKLGLENVHTEIVEDQGVRVAMLPIGESRLELLEPIVPTSPVAKFLESRGEGIHHIALDVDSVEAGLEDLAAKGVALVDKKPRRGAHNKKIAFLHPKSTNGVLLEICKDWDS